MNNEEIIYIKKWFQKAEHDMITAGLLIEQKPLIMDVACYHCQQAVEKYLKAFLVYNKKAIIKTHSLDFLQLECSKIDSDFSEIDFRNLEDYATDIRYPDDFLQPDLKEAKEYYSMAVEVQKLVVGKIKLD